MTTYLFLGGPKHGQFVETDDSHEWRVTVTTPVSALLLSKDALPSATVAHYVRRQVASPNMRDRFRTVYALIGMSQEDASAALMNVLMQHLMSKLLDAFIYEGGELIDQGSEPDSGSGIA